MYQVKNRINRNSTRVEIGNSAKEMVAFGQSNGWEFPVLGYAPMPESVIHINGWLVVPAHLDSTPLPDRAQKRMNAIHETGIRPKGWVLIHEAPALLPESTVKEEHVIQPGRISPKTRQKAKIILKASGSVLGAVAVATGTLALAVAAAALILPAFLIMGALVIDPILVAVTEDGFWVEIDRWDI